MRQGKKILKGIAVAVVLGIIGYAVYQAINNEYFEQIINMIDKNTPPFLFISLMLILTVVGFPISIFLVMIGIKFGLFWAIVLGGLILPVHALVG